MAIYKKWCNVTGTSQKLIIKVGKNYASSESNHIKMKEGDLFKNRVDVDNSEKTCSLS